MEMDVACWKGVDVNYSNDSSIFTHGDNYVDYRGGIWEECCHFTASQPLRSCFFYERHLQRAPRRVFGPIVLPRQSNSAAPSVN